MLGNKAERQEKTGFDFLPRGSLLVWIDSFLDDPLIEEDRTVGQLRNLLADTEANLPETLDGQIFVKAYGYGKCQANSDPQKHSHFSSRYRFWNPECWRPSTQNSPECVCGSGRDWIQEAADRISGGQGMCRPKLRLKPASEEIK